MRKWIIETVILSSLIGLYIMYGHLLVDQMASQQGWNESSYLYAAGAVIVIIFGSFIGKILTRGMH